MRVGIPAASDGARICQLSPPSMDRKMPTPGYESAERLASPVPQYTMDGRVRTTATEPIMRVGWLTHHPPPLPPPASPSQTPPATRPGQNGVSFLGGASVWGHAPAYIGRADQFPLGGARLRCKRGRCSR